jgi:tubulin-specific chaperone E
MGQEFYKGQRLSLNGALCTVWYIGKVEGTEGDWLGIEWDEKRGKHSGEYNGRRYFKCENSGFSLFLLHSLTVQ